MVKPRSKNDKNEISYDSIKKGRCDAHGLAIYMTTSTHSYSKDKDIRSQDPM